MKFAWNTALVDLEDQEVKDQNGNSVSLGVMAIRALTAPDAREIPGEEKVKRFIAAQKIQTGHDLDLTEAALVKDIVGRMLSPLPVGRIWDLLERPIA